MRVHTETAVTRIERPGGVLTVSSDPDLPVEAGLQPLTVESRNYDHKAYVRPEVNVA